jgi:quercetin dioxygenase-like cupin family protein
MEIKNLSNAQKVPFDLDGWSLINTDKAELVYLKLKPGDNLEKHKNPFDVIFFVISGEGMLSVEHDEKVLKPNDSIFISNTKNRGWSNNSEEELIILVYKILG